MKSTAIEPIPRKTERDCAVMAEITLALLPDQKEEAGILASKFLELRLSNLVSWNDMTCLLCGGSIEKSESFRGIVRHFVNDEVHGPEIRLRMLGR